MPLEPTFSDISKLNPSWPTDGDLIKNGDDHIRGIKTAIQGTFPNIKSPLTTSDTKLNALDANVDATNGALTIKVPVDMQAKRITNLADPAVPTDASTAQYVATNFQAKSGLGDVAITGKLDVTGITTFGANVNMGSHRLVGLPDPAGNEPSEAINKGFSDAHFQYKDPTNNSVSVAGSLTATSGLTVQNGATFSGGTTFNNGVVAKSTARVEGGLTVLNGASVSGGLTSVGDISANALTTSHSISAGGALQWGGAQGTTVTANQNSGDAIVSSYIGSTRWGVTGGYICRAGTGGGFGSNVFNFLWRQPSDTSLFVKREQTGEVGAGASSVNPHQHYVMEAGSPGLDLFIDNSIVGRVAFAYTSDRELKKDIVGVSDARSALEEVNQWKPVTYSYKARGELPEVSGKFGFIANELKAVSPETVKGVGIKEGADINDPEVFKDAYELDQVALIAKLTLAVQELTKRVHELEEKK